ncbi:hypothetical protein BU15DRAFT_90984 [Melanogaster broomeanus]|nr:hypothetical protein BU15DRAFT_90984 [Melanogaster broomeanus]
MSTSDHQHTHIPVTLRSALKQPSRSSSASPAHAVFTTPPSRCSTEDDLQLVPCTSTSIAMPYPTSASRPSTAATTNSFFALGGSNQIYSPNLHPITSPSVAAQGYTPKVSFDTFENPAASMFSFTLHVQSEGYARTRATLRNESGREALEWALECLVQDADELIVFRGIDQDELDKDHELVREEARDLMRQIQEKCVEYDAERKVSIILETIAGRPTATLDRLIALYRPDSVVVGTRGQRSVMSGVLGFGGLGSGVRGGGVFSSVGSVSKYTLSHSPVPIIVVRPERKRGTHFDELRRSKTQTIDALPMTPSTTRT